MPTSLREQALAAFFTRLQTIAGVTTFARNPTREFDTFDELPAVIQFDGGEAEGEPQMTGVLVLNTQVTALVWVRAATQTTIGQTVNDYAARVRQAMGGDPTLGGLALFVRYDGCDDPVLLTEEGAPPTASMGMSFVIERQEAELNPYTFI